MEFTEIFHHGAKGVIENGLVGTITQHFGLRGRELHYNLNVEDFTLLTDDEGRNYYCLKNGPEKNHQGGLNCKRRLVEPKMFTPYTPCNVACDASPLSTFHHPQSTLAK